MWNIRTKTKHHTGIMDKTTAPDTKHGDVEGFETVAPTPEQIRELLGKQGGLRLSLYLPISVEPPESEKNPLRLEQLLDKARGELRREGMEEDNLKEFLRPFRTFQLAPRELLRHAETLAFFVGPRTVRMMELPHRLSPGADVGNSWVLKPLLPFLEFNRTFTTICLSRGNVRVFRGSRIQVREEEIPGMPEKLEDVAQYDDAGESIQHHASKTSSARGAPGSSPVAQHHGQGESADLREKQVKEFFQAVAAAINPVLAGRKEPVLLFGVEKNIGLFRPALEVPGKRVFEGHHDPGKWKEEQVREHSWERLEPGIAELTKERIAELERAWKRDEGIFDVGKCAVAAANGRIETVAVATDQFVPGICNPEKMEVRYIDKGDAGCVHDLLEYIAAETIRNGGEALPLKMEEIPGDTEVGATTRF